MPGMKKLSDRKRGKFKVMIMFFMNNLVGIDIHVPKFTRQYLPACQNTSCIPALNHIHCSRLNRAHSQRLIFCNVSFHRLLGVRK
jgi:hypothetical protein